MSRLKSTDISKIRSVSSYYEVETSPMYGFSKIEDEFSSCITVLSLDHRMAILRAAKRGYGSPSKNRINPHESSEYACWRVRQKGDDVVYYYGI